VLREITYQTIVMGIFASLSKNQKKQWSSFLVSLGIYCLLNGKHALKEVEELENMTQKVL